MSDFNAARTILAEIDRVVTSIGTDDRETVQWMIVKVREALALLRPEPAPRPMTGILATLTDEQREAVLAYDGDETLGDPNDPALKPVAWRCKDFGDDWFIMQSERQASEYQAETGCLMQPLYAHHAPTCTAQTGPAAACVYREPLLRTAADMERG